MSAKEIPAEGESIHPAVSAGWNTFEPDGPRYRGRWTWYFWTRKPMVASIAERPCLSSAFWNQAKLAGLLSSMKIAPRGGHLLGWVGLGWVGLGWGGVGWGGVGWWG